MRASTLAAAIVLLAGPPAAAAELITNGSFETPLVPAGSFTTFGSGSTGITGWTVVGAAGGVAVVDGTFTQNGISFVAGDGNQWLDLTGLGTNDVEGVEQTVSTIAGHTYTLSFKIGNVVDTGGVFGTASGVTIFINGTFFGTASLSGGNGTTLTYNTFAFPGIFATSALTTIRIVNADPANDNSNALDAVSFTGDPGEVPEPATWSLMILAFGATAFARRRFLRTA